MSAKIILTCPSYWSETTVRLLADRLAADELPQAVGIEIDYAERFMEEVLRKVNNEL